MARELHTIPFEDFTRRVRSIFDDVSRGGQPVLVERDGVVYRIEAQPGALRTAASSDIWADYDPAKVQAAFTRAQGLLKGVDTGQLKRDLKRQREQAQKGPPAG